MYSRMPESRIQSTEPKLPRAVNKNNSGRSPDRPLFYLPGVLPMAYDVDLLIEQGADYAIKVQITDDSNEPIDLTGFTAQGQMRKHYTSSAAYDFEVELFSDVVESYLLLTMANEDTSIVPAGRYVYDVKLTGPDGKVSRIIQGTATVGPEVTR